MANDYKFNSVVKNTPIQGIAADITKMQMCKLWKDIFSKREDVKCLFNIYDEFNFSVPRENTVNLIKNILDTMKVTVKGWQVPFTCSCEIGKTWGTTFKFKYNQEQEMFLPSIKI
jgi:DNA polymerase I-like protein with 3'-5' exonuclease and polymerase domains